MRGTHARESQSMRSEYFMRKTIGLQHCQQNKHAIFKSQSNSCETEINTVAQQSL